MRILIEAAGSVTSGYLIKSIKSLGYEVVGSDINGFNHAAYMCDDFVVLPKADDKDLWRIKEKIIKDKCINIVIPSLDETLLGWSERRDYFRSIGVEVVVSPRDTVDIFLDKWKTYLFFVEHGIRTPKTSLEPIYELIKPRFGRGGKGIRKNDYTNINMDGMISQESIIGKEYTVDVLFSRDGEPIYIVPRLRLEVRDGKSIKGMVVNNPKIAEIIEKISKKIMFIGPVNFQLFETDEGELFFIEVNPRIAGGMALGFAATENWIRLIVDNIVLGKDINKNELKPIRYGLKMVRYYDEIFIP